MSARSDRIITVARQELGTTEGRSSVGWNNHVKYTEGTAAAGQPWCLWFVVWIARRARVPTSIIPDIGSCGQLMRWAIRNGRWRGVARRGDIVLINAKPGSKVPVHCGIVEHVHPSGTLHTIEGNTNADGAPEGYIVMRRIRPMSRIVGVVPVRTQP